MNWISKNKEINFIPSSIKNIIFDYKEAEEIFGIRIKETNKVIVYVNGRLANKHDPITIRTELYNCFVGPNQWFEISGFAEAFKEFEMRYGEAAKGRKTIKKFKSKLSDENKLLLEVL